MVSRLVGNSLITVAGWTAWFCKHSRYSLPSSHKAKSICTTSCGSSCVSGWLSNSKRSFASLSVYHRYIAMIFIRGVFICHEALQAHQYVFATLVTGEGYSDSKNVGSNQSTCRYTLSISCQPDIVGMWELIEIITHIYIQDLLERTIFEPP